MFDVLLTGKLRSAPEVRTSRNGNPFATFRLSVPTGKDGGCVWVSCITFHEAAIEAIEALGEGDAVSVNGEAAIKLWEGRNGAQAGLDVTVHGVLTAYHLGRKRDAVARSGGAGPARGATTTPTQPKFQHPDFQPPKLSDADLEEWGSLDGI